MCSRRARAWCFTLFRHVPACSPVSGLLFRSSGSRDSLDSDGSGGCCERPSGSRGIAGTSPVRGRYKPALPTSVTSAFFKRRVPNLLSPPSEEEEEEKYPEGDSESDRTPQTVEDALRACHQVTYYIFQEEQAPSTQRIHYQGYLRFTASRTASAVKSSFPWPDIHLEIAHGSCAQNKAYCSKLSGRISGPYEYGEAAEVPGTRTDLHKTRELVFEGKGMREIVQEVTSYQALKFAESLLKYAEKPRDFYTQVFWFHGSTGSGKTREAMALYPNAWISGKNLKWWDGYDAHSEVIIDDFRKDFCTFHELLRICDRYPYRVETKGGSRQLLAKIIVITCPWEPDVLFSSRSTEDVGQLLRRIFQVRLFGDVVPPPSLAASSTSVHYRNSV